MEHVVSKIFLIAKRCDDCKLRNLNYILRFARTNLFPDIELGFVKKMFVQVVISPCECNKKFSYKGSYPISKLKN